MPKYDAPEPFAGNFVEYTSVWTVGERKQFFKLEGEEYLALLKKKVTAIHLDCVDADPITSPDDLITERYDCVDGNLWEWFRSTPLAALRDVSRMGEAMRSQLFSTPEETTASAESPQKA